MKRVMFFLALFGLIVLSATGCNQQPKNILVVISIGGSSTEDIHEVVQECAEDVGITLALENWIQDRGGDILVEERDVERVWDEIEALVEANGGDKENLRLIVVGKSAGGVLAWETLRQHHDGLALFQKSALVMIDPHGSVYNDDNVGPYSDDQDLTWPSSWNTNQNVYRVYNIYQYHDSPTGASFPSSKVYRNIFIDDVSVTHSNITQDQRTKELITDAFTFIGY